jgi:hypothetical protein
VALLSIPTVRTPRGQPHRSIGARPVLPAHAPTIVVQRIFLPIDVRRAAHRRTRRADLSKRRDPASALADPPTADERRLRVNDTALALSLLRLGLTLPLALTLHAPSELRDSRDDPAVLLRAASPLRLPRTAAAPLLPIRPAPLPLLLLRRPRFPRRATRKPLAPWFHP